MNDRLPNATHMPLLTIAIPSYNRNRILSQNLALLLPQLNHECAVTIIDNASETPLRETLTCLESFTECSVNIIRNRVNIGGNANILRCFETCTTEWLWILSDDDPVRPDAVAEVLRHIQIYSSALCINFWCTSNGGGRERLRISRGIAGFARELDSFWNVLFISANVYKASTLMPFLRLGYNYAYSCAPHLAVLLAALGEGGLCCFSKEEIVALGEVPMSDRFSPLLPALGKMTLLELPMGAEERRLLARKMSCSPRLEYLALVLVHLACRRKSNDEAIFLFDQLCARLYWWEKSPLLWARRIVCRSAIRHFRLAKWAAELGEERLTGKRWERYTVPLGRAKVDEWQRL